jgi:hypothetical protein
LALLDGAEEYKSSLLHVKKLWAGEPTEFGAGYTFAILETVGDALIYFFIFLFSAKKKTSVAHRLGCFGCLVGWLVGCFWLFGVFFDQVTNAAGQQEEAGGGCEEFLVDMTVFERMAARHGLVPVTTPEYSYYHTSAEAPGHHSDAHGDHVARHLDAIAGHPAFHLFRPDYASDLPPTPDAAQLARFAEDAPELERISRLARFAEDAPELERISRLNGTFVFRKVATGHHPPPVVAASAAGSVSEPDAKKRL